MNRAQSFQLAFCKNPDQVTLRSFSQDTNLQFEKEINFSEIEKFNPQLVIISEEMSQTDDQSYLFEKEIQFSAFETATNINLTYNQFIELDYPNAQAIFDESFSKWILLNNMALLENIFPKVNDLKDLHKNNYHTFLHDMWKLLRNNLGCQNLRIIFNDVTFFEDNDQDENKEKKQKRSKLITRSLVGERSPEFEEENEAFTALHNKYIDVSVSDIDIIEHNQEMKELTMLISAFEKRYIVMANIPSLNMFQESLLIAFFKGLNIN